VVKKPIFPMPKAEVLEFSFASLWRSSGEGALVECFTGLFRHEVKYPFA
jgi:hypothetical protein